MADVCLVNVPYGALERPSLALSVLKPALQQVGISCDLVYSTFRFAEMIGTVPYADMVWVRGEMIGEWTFSGAAFPDFAPDHEEYMRRIMASYAPGDEASASRIENLLWRIRAKAEVFVKELAEEIVSGNPRILGISSTFNQHCAALALARQVKALNPAIVTVLGGGNCEGEMGLTTAEEFPWVDWVVSGEGEDIFPRLCRRILDGEEENPSAIELPPGVFGKPHRSALRMLDGGGETPRAIVQDLNTTPEPDFDDYFRALDKFSGRRFITPGLLVETSRGCWWGAIKHCTFCGLNGGSMEYRSKSPDRAVSEIRSLAQRYGVPRFLVVDNILDMSYFKDVLPTLAASPEKLTFFYEIKSNVTLDHLRALKAAGVTWLQPGIESLHDEALKLMEKGTTSWLNVQLLKWARELGLSIGWNILCGFPGESDGWYAEMAEFVPLIEHLEPSTELRPIRFDRFSPYQASPEKYGLGLVPAWPYAYIYPRNRQVLSRLVYGFEAADRPQQYTNPLRIQREEMPSLGGQGRDLLQKRIRDWQRAFLSVVPPILSMREADGETLILDTRSIAPEPRVVLRGLEHRVHSAAHASGTAPMLHERVNADGGGTVELSAISETIEQLIGRKLMAKLGARYLTLAVPGELPRLPRNHREGYPGGWVQRPQRRRTAFVSAGSTNNERASKDAEIQNVR